MNKKTQTAKYIITDLLTALIVWVLFYCFRLIEFDKVLPKNVLAYFPMYNFLLLLFFVPFFWFVLYYVSGYYNQVFRKSRLSELMSTFICSFFGCLFLFFLLLLDDPVESYTHYYISFICFFSLQFFITYAGRLLLTQSATKKIHNRIWGFNTLVVGTGKNAKRIADELNQMRLSLGNNIIGFLMVDNQPIKVDEDKIVGTWQDFDQIVSKHNVQEIIIATEKNDNRLIFNMLNDSYKYRIEVKMIPQLREIVKSGIRMTTIYATPLISLSHSEMPYWQQNIKRIADVVASALVMILLSPVFLYISLKVKLSSHGSVFYSQERIGKFGEPFNILKFRTMKVDSENGHPLLASENDPRITPFGRKLRKYRLDELPQFWNVIKGNMSLVGYRPERRYFINQITKKSPHYYLLQKIRPGITSWGMVKYGYADHVDKMVERLEYDIIYVENQSLLIDLKILIYTFKIIFSGRGI